MLGKTLFNSGFGGACRPLKYKAQQSAEREFGFLKDPLFFTDSIFINSPERVEALAMVMGLCLLVYTLGQRQLRQALQQAQLGIKNQLGKLTKLSTALSSALS